jgi:hypothetical protein
VCRRAQNLIKRVTLDECDQEFDDCCRSTLASLKVKLFTDGADKARSYNKQSWIWGFTTNPSLLKKPA